MLKLHPKISENYIKLLPKVVPKINFQKYSPKLSLFKAIVHHLLQSRKVASHNYSPKLLFKIATESRVPKQLPKTPNLLPEAASKLARKSCPKLLPKAVPRRSSPKLCPKGVLQSCCPKAATLQTSSPKWLPKAILQSGSRKLLPKAAPQTCSTKPLPKLVIESCSEQLLPKAAKAPPKVVAESCFPKFISKATPQSCRSSKQLLQTRKVAPHSCSPKLLPKAASQGSSPKQRAQDKEASTVCAVAGGCSKRDVSQRCVLERAQRE